MIVVVKKKFKIKYILLAILSTAVTFGVLKQNKIEETHIPVKEVSEISDSSDLDSWAAIISNRLNDSLLSYGITGGAYAIVHNSEVLVKHVHGLQKQNTTDSINENTLFRLASVSKTFTGILASKLVEEGTINLDEKIIDIIPDFQLKDSVNTNTVTIRHILSHTAGLVPHAYDNLLDHNVPVKQILPMLKDAEISAKPGVLYSYQNVMFSLFDTIVQVKTGKTYEQLVEEKIFQPLGMYTASNSFKDFIETNNYTYPHTRVKNGYAATRLNKRYYLPAAGVNASINDMAKYLLALTGYAPDKISQQVLDTCFKEQVVSPLRYHYLKYWDRKSVDTKHYALGWRVIKYKNRKILYHGGYVRSYRAEIMVCPEEKLGFAFISNAPSRFASQCVPIVLDDFIKQIDDSLYYAETSF